MISNDQRSWNFEKEKIKNWRHKFESKGRAHAQNEVFCNLLEFRYVLLEIACNERDSVKLLVKVDHEKNVRAQIWTKRTKSGSDIRFFAIFSS